MPLAEINRITDEEFVRAFGGVYEASPWVAEGVLPHRPFESADSFKSAFRVVVEEAGEERQEALIVAHPDLGGKLARRGDLGRDSAAEQSRLGLDRLDDAEFEEFTRLNRAYHERFGFPFIICVGLLDRPAILAAFRERLENSREEERAEALRQIHLIAALRIAQLLESPG